MIDNITKAITEILNISKDDFSVQLKDGEFFNATLSGYPPGRDTISGDKMSLIKKRIAELDAASIPPTREQVNDERDRRIAANFVFDGRPYQFDEMSKQRINGAATLAGFAIGRGAPEGNLRWADPDNDFVFISSDDVFVPMDAHKCFAFGQAAARHENKHIFAASAIKKIMPEDYKDDQYWP